MTTKTESLKNLQRIPGIGKSIVTFKLTESKTPPSGVIIASYKRVGKVKIGSFKGKL